MTTALLVCLHVAFGAESAGAFDGVVEKKVFELAEYTTTNGAVLHKVRIGWESYGTLNEARDNAILIPHHFFGSSHAAGLYGDEKRSSGYWDDLIGPGRAIDTDRFFVISADTLVNLNAKDPNVITTGPASINPDTGRPYGMTFPVVSIRDFVNVQAALLDSLGIHKLYAVAGPSMGGLQTLEWAAAYPERVGRAVAVITGGETGAFQIAWMARWTAPIRLDPNWNNGDYYGREEPAAGLAEAYRLAALLCRQAEWADQKFGRGWAKSGQDPRAGLENLYAIERWLDTAVARAARVADANHFLYLARAVQTYVIGNGDNLEKGAAAIKAPVLLLPAAGDLVFPPDQSRKLHTVLTAQGTPAEIDEIPGPAGHLNGLGDVERFAEHLRAFLNRPLP